MPSSTVEGYESSTRLRPLEIVYPGSTATAQVISHGDTALPTREFRYFRHLPKLADIYEPTQSSEVLHPGITATAEIMDQKTIEQYAWRLIRDRDHIPEVVTTTNERHRNAGTDIMERLTKDGHLSRVEMSGTLEEINQHVLKRLLNGWSDSLPVHEQQRRFAEICEELTIEDVHRRIVRGELAWDTAVGTISDFPASLDDALANMLGYRASNDKGMVRTSKLVQNPDGTYTRVLEQISRSNSSDNSTFSFLEACGIQLAHNEELGDDVAALSTQFLFSSEDYQDEVIDIQRRLDKHAGPGMRYGRPADHEQIAYENLRTESARREKQVEYYTTELAAFDEHLEYMEKQGIITTTQRTRQYKAQLRQYLRAICTLAPNYAEGCFGAQAAAHYTQAALWYARKGDFQPQRLMALEQARLTEEVSVGCGGAIGGSLATMFSVEISDVGTEVKNGKEKWLWTTGECCVPHCPSPKPTEVGPCSVCHRCQSYADDGKDLMTLYN